MAKRRCLLVLLLVVGAIAATSGIALAHAIILLSDPPGDGVPLTRGPMSVRVIFSEPIEPFGVGMSVLGPTGRRVDRPPVRISGSAMGIDVDASATGTYLVEWEVIASDTHPTRGSFTFNVGQPGGALTQLSSTGSPAELGAVDPIGLLLQVAARWLHLIGYSVSFGVVAFEVIVLRSDARLPQATPNDRSGAADRRLDPLINLGIGLLLVAEPLALLGQTASLGVNQMLDPATTSAALDSSFGRALGERLGAPLLLWVLLGIIRDGSYRVRWLVLLLGGGLAILDGGSAHASSVRPVAVGFLLTATHVAASGIWVGGVASIVRLWSMETGAQWKTVRGKLLERFRLVAGLAALAVGVSGIALAALHSIRIDELVATPFALALVGKTAIAIGVISIAFAVARFRWRPHGWWIAETVGLGAILGLAGLVASLPPPT